MRIVSSARLFRPWFALMLASGLLVSTPAWRGDAAPLEAPHRLAQNDLEARAQQIIELYEQGRYEEAIPLRYSTT